MVASKDFVPVDFEVPEGLDSDLFRLEPLGPQHNKRDYEAWMSSIGHIRSTPGFEGSDWPRPMTSEENLADLVGHSTDFERRRGFTYSVLEEDDVVGCVYIYPATDDEHDAAVASWVRADRAQLDEELWAAVGNWLADAWPFSNPSYAERL